MIIFHVNMKQIFILNVKDLQKVRSFKLHGAYYAMSQLPGEELKREWYVLRQVTMPKVLLILLKI